MSSKQDSKRTQGLRTEGTTASMSNMASNAAAARRPNDFAPSAISRAGIGAQFTDRSVSGVKAKRSSGNPYPQTLDSVATDTQDNQDHASARKV